MQSESRVDLQHGGLGNSDGSALLNVGGIAEGNDGIETVIASVQGQEDEDPATW